MPKQSHGPFAYQTRRCTQHRTDWNAVLFVAVLIFFACVAGYLATSAIANAAHDAVNYNPCFSSGC